MLKITVIILASIISAVILQDVNNEWGTQPQNLDEPCARKGTPVVEKQVAPSYISSPPQSLPLEKVIYEQQDFEPIVNTPNTYEPLIYDPRKYEPLINEQHKPLINEQHKPLINEQHKPLINEQHKPLINGPNKYEPLINEPNKHKPLINEPNNHKPLIYEQKTENFDEPNYYNNRRKIYPNPTVPHTSDEIVENSPRLATDKIPTKDCLDPLPFRRSQTRNFQPLDTRQGFGNDGVQNEYKNDHLLENNYAQGGHGVKNDDIYDPILRTDVSVVSDKHRPLLVNNPRVCYACSSATNPTCREPNKRTTIKYCKKDRASCVTKTFGEGQSLTVIRDCASSCADSSIPGLQPKYKSCKVCHSDLCNSAFSIKSYKLLYVLLLFTAFKFSF